MKKSKFYDIINIQKEKKERSDMKEKLKVTLESSYPVEPEVYIFELTSRQNIEEEISDLITDYFFIKRDLLELQDVSDEQLLSSISYSMEYIVEEEDYV